MSKTETGNVDGIVVSDAGPLIGLARAGYLALLKDISGSVCMPPEVHHELQPQSNLPGADYLLQALTDGWLKVCELSRKSREGLSDLLLILDPGEAEATRSLHKSDGLFP